MNSQKAFPVTALIGSMCLVMFAYAGLQGSAQRTETPRDEESSMLTQSVIEQGITVTLKCPAELISGDRNDIIIEVRNDSDRDVAYYGMPPQGLGVSFTLHRRGTLVDKTSLGRAYLETGIVIKWRSPTIIGQGETHRAVLNLTRYYDLSLAGDYQIAAKWIGMPADNLARDPEDDDWEPNYQIQTDPLDVRITVKSGEHRLRAVED